MRTIIKKILAGTTVFMFFSCTNQSNNESVSKENFEVNTEPTSPTEQIVEYIKDKTFTYYHLCNRFDEFGDSKIEISSLYRPSKIRFYGTDKAVVAGTKWDGDFKFEKKIEIEGTIICTIDSDGLKKGVRQYFSATFEEYGLKLISTDQSIVNSQKRMGDIGTIDVGYILSKEEGLKSIN